MRQADPATAAPTRYGAIAQSLRWPTALLVLAAYVHGPGGSALRVCAPARDLERQIHETLGLCVFALLVVRVFWRRRGTRPALPALYLLLAVVPVTAAAGAWLEGHPLTLHTVLGDAILGIAGAHAAAGPYHHLVRQDGVRVSILPRWLPLGAQRL